MLLASSHLVIATSNVERITKFFAELFELSPHFANREFAEFVLPSRFRIAFFVPVGKSKESFDTGVSRGALAIGLTVTDVDNFYQKVMSRQDCQTAGEPKNHPWGEKSFLLTDPDGNRWEITQSPEKDGMLVTRSS